MFTAVCSNVRNTLESLKLGTLYQLQTDCVFKNVQQCPRLHTLLLPEYSYGGKLTVEFELPQLRALAAGSNLAYILQRARNISKLAMNASADYFLALSAVASTITELNSRAPPLIEELKVLSSLSALRRLDLGEFSVVPTDLPTFASTAAQKST